MDGWRMMDGWIDRYIDRQTGKVLAESLLALEGQCCLGPSPPTLDWSPPTSLPGECPLAFYNTAFDKAFPGSPQPCPKKS
jgi:hypothetical protein